MEDLAEVKKAMAEAGLSPVDLRRGLRAELGRVADVAARPLHRSPALRKIFKRGDALAAVDGESTRPAHLLLALIESGDRAVSAALTKLGQDSFEVGWRRKTPGHKRQEKRENGQQAVAEKEEKPKKPTALERFGRDLTALAAEGALSPCQWVAKRKRSLRAFTDH